MTKRQRRAALYFVLAALLLNIVVPVLRGAPVPGELYAVLGTIAGYLLVGERKEEDRSGELPPKRDDDPAPDSDKAPK